VEPGARNLMRGSSAMQEGMRAARCLMVASAHRRVVHGHGGPAMIVSRCSSCSALRWVGPRSPKSRAPTWSSHACWVASWAELNIAWPAVVDLLAPELRVLVRCELWWCVVASGNADGRPRLTVAGDGKL
jgi:hypothetical protein